MNRVPLRSYYGLATVVSIPRQSCRLVDSRQSLAERLASTSHPANRHSAKDFCTEITGRDFWHFSCVYLKRGRFPHG